MTRTHILGFPRIGPQRELKRALEGYWEGASDERALASVGSAVQKRNWALQGERLDFVTCGDFSFYDHVLDTTALLGALPPRFGFDPVTLTRSQYFELARGNDREPAMELTKWFDTNYHYLVPELGHASRFETGIDAYYDDVREALATGYAVKPVLIGPLTYLRLAKSTGAFDRLTLLPAVLAAYSRILERLRQLGVDWVQLDEPALCTELDDEWLAAYERAYAALAGKGPKILLATYFGRANDCARLSRLPVAGFHVDCVRAPEQLELWRTLLPAGAVLSAGIIDGRNVWRTDLRQALQRLTPMRDALGDRLWIAPSCSLLHVPISAAAESTADAEVAPWLAFAEEKLAELQTLGRALTQGGGAVAEALDESDARQASRRSSARAVNELVRDRVAAVTEDTARRRSSYAVRSAIQRSALGLPLLPTTTIGSFPQTPAVRQTRARHRRREITSLTYLHHIRSEIEDAVRRQEALGLDVLVHGEAERNDMVEHFAEHLWGFAITTHGWVQSYGSRCVKPPIIFGDVYRPDPMTVETTRFAQSLTSKPMKGMLTGPVTLLQWSFVRDDQPRAATALQLALAIRDEVEDLEKAGIRVIQIDEPALREGLPLAHSEWEAYLEWAVHAFRVAAGGAQDATQIHTHMCYSEFGDILPAIADLDADVITIETSRSGMALLDAFGEFRYPNEIGPGVYDIHSPRVPSRDDMLRLLRRAARVIPVERLWVNPDCGLKTRGWHEAEHALRLMVEAASLLRGEIAGTDAGAPAAVGAAS